MAFSYTVINQSELRSSLATYKQGATHHILEHASPALSRPSLITNFKSNMAMDFISFYLLLLLSHLLFRAILERWSKNGRKAGGAQLLPSPPALPIIGHLHLLRPLLHQAFHALAKRYGPLFRLYLPSIGNLLVVSSPAVAKEFLKSQDPLVTARPHFVADDFLGEGAVSYVFLPSGPFWRFMKKLFVAELFSTKQLERTASIRQEEIRRLLVSLLEKSKLGEAAEVEGMLATLANSIMFRMVMSARFSGEDEEVQAVKCQKMVREMVELAGKLNMMHLVMGRLGKLDLLGYGRRLREANDRFMLMMEKIKDEHEKKQKKRGENNNDTTEEDEGEEEKDLLDALLKISADQESELKL